MTNQKNASFFRKRAREALKGNWKIAILATWLTALLGGLMSNSISPSLDFEKNDTPPSSELPEFMNFTAEEWELFKKILFTAAAVIFVMFLISFFVGSIVRIGHARFCLNLLDKEPLSVKTVFSYFPNYGNLLLATFIKNLFVFLWSLLFVIPGLLAEYSYALTPYLLAEDPTLAPRAALKRSKELMNGNRWRLFCLQLSFIGWDLLSVLSLGIGSLWLNPYSSTATAAFYRELCAKKEPEAPQTTRSYDYGPNL